MCFAIRKHTLVNFQAVQLVITNCTWCGYINAYDGVNRSPSGFALASCNMITSIHRVECFFNLVFYFVKCNLSTCQLKRALIIIYLITYLLTVVRYNGRVDGKS